MLTPLPVVPDDTRAWSDIPGVAWIGLLMGLALLVAAIRAMFGKGKK